MLSNSPKISRKAGNNAVIAGKLRPSSGLSLAILPNLEKKDSGPDSSADGPRRVVHKLIDRLVVGLTAELNVQSAASQQSFERAVREPLTREIVYTKLVVRINNALARDQQLIVLKSVLLIKQYLFLYAPSTFDTLSGLYDVLLDIDDRSQNWQPSALTINACRTVHFLLTYLSCTLCNHPRYKSRHRKRSNTHFGAQRAPAGFKPAASICDIGSSSAIDKPETASAASVVSNAEMVSRRRSVAPGSYTADLALAGLDTTTREDPRKSLVPSELSLVNDVMFGGQFAKGSLFLQPGDLGARSGLEAYRSQLVHNPGATYEQEIMAVALQKKKEERDRMQPQHQIASQMLFQYRPYNEQSRLETSSEDIELIFAAMLDDDASTRKMAAKILIKILIDLYLLGQPANATQIIRTICTQLLNRTSTSASADEIRRSKYHAFDFIWNFAIHINLIADNIVSLPTAALMKYMLSKEDTGSSSGSRGLLDLKTPSHPSPTTSTTTSTTTSSSSSSSTPTAVPSSGSSTAATRDLSGSGGSGTPSAAGGSATNTPTGTSNNSGSIDADSHSTQDDSDPSTSTSDLGGGSVFVETSTQQNKANRQLVDKILMDIVEILRDLIGTLHTSGETEEAVWSVAFTCLLSLVSREGRILPEYSFALTPLIIVNMLRYLQDDSLHGRLVRLLVHGLSVPAPVLSQSASDSSLASARAAAMPNTPTGEEATPRLRQVADLKLIESIGGINTIIELYVSLQSVSAKCNLFAIIYSYIIQRRQLHSRKYQNIEFSIQADALFLLLCLIDAPQQFWRFFVVLPDDLLKRLGSKIKRYQAHIDKIMPRVVVFKSGMIKHVVKSLARLAHDYLKLAPEYDAHLKYMLASNAGKDQDDIFDKEIADRFDTLNGLLHSNDNRERKSGESWLFALAKASIDGQINSHQLRTGISSTFEKITSSGTSKVRASHMRIIEKMIIYRLYNMKAHTERRQLALVLELFNSNLAAAVTQDERDWMNLTLMFYTTFNFIIRYRVQAMPVGDSLVFDLETDERFPGGDAPYALFLIGKATVSTQLIAELNISLFSQLFTHLPTRKSRYHRVALLMIMIHKCKTKKADLDTLDISFFRSLLKSRDPEIALNGARFLLEHLRSNEPSEYIEIVEWCVTLGQKNGDAGLLTNPYLQINALMNRRGPTMAESAPDTHRPHQAALEPDPPPQPALLPDPVNPRSGLQPPPTLLTPGLGQQATASPRK